MQSAGALLIDVSDAIIQRYRPTLASPGTRFCVGCGDVLAIVGGALGWANMTTVEDRGLTGAWSADVCSKGHETDRFIFPALKAFVVVLM
jgi:hypothetical protein